jgi:K+-sensing histidine kinase KdpD
MYLSYYRPFKEPLILFSEFVGEICVINAFIASIFFLDDKNLFEVQDVEDVIIYSVLCAMCAQMMVCIYYTVKSLVKMWKKFRKSRELSFSTKIGKEPDSALIAGRSSTMVNKMIEENQ